MGPLDDEVETAAAPSSQSPFTVLWRHRFLVLLGGVVGVVLGALVYAQRPAVYQSAAQVLVVKKRSDALPMSGLDPRASFYEDYVSTHLILLRSPLVAQDAVRKRKLTELRSFQGQDAVGAVLGGLSANREASKDSSAPPSNVINLAYRGGDPADTAAVLSAVIDSYRDFLDDTYRNVSRTTFDLITKARNHLQKDLREETEKYSKFRDDPKTPLLPRTSDGPNIYLSRIREFEAQQTQLLVRSGQLTERLRSIEDARKKGESNAVLLQVAARPLDGKAGATPAAAVARETMTQQLEDRLLTLQVKEKGLLMDYGRHHPDVVRVREEIAMTRKLWSDRQKRVAKLAQAGVDGDRATGDALLDQMVHALRAELALVNSSNQALVALIKESYETARKMESYETQDKEFRKGISRSEAILEETQKRLQEINLVRDSGGFDARVISEPGPGGKVSPFAWQFLFAGAFLGLAVGVGVAYLLEVTDKSFRTPEEIRKRLGLPIVGHVPFFAHAEGPVEVTTPDGISVHLDPALLVHHRPRSVEAEAYRSVRTALYFNTHGERHKVIQVTSPNMSDGKSTLIANLAVAIAQSGRKVVLVDADLRRPRVHRVFGVSTRRGMAQVIGGEVALADAIQPTVIPNLSVLPCGPRPAQPAELLTLPRFADTLEELREMFDYVLVDTPPLLAVSDPCAIAPRVDGVLLTIRVSKNGRPAAERARDLLIGLRVHLYGVVVNGVGKQGAMAGYGYEHYHYAADYSSEYASADHDAPEGGDPAPAVPPAATGTGHPPHAPHGTNGVAAAAGASS